MDKQIKSIFNIWVICLCVFIQPLWAESFDKNVRIVNELLTHDSETAIKKGHNLFLYADSLNHPEKKAEALKLLSLAYYYNGQHKFAKESIDVALNIYKDIDDDSGISACLNIFGILKKDLGFYDEAETFFQQALEIDKKNNDFAGMAVLYNNLGELYHVQNRSYLSAYYYVSSLKMEFKVGNEGGVADSYMNIGTLLKDNLLYDEAIKYYIKAQSVYGRTQNIFRLGQLYNNMGLVYFNLKQYHKAVSFYKQSLEHKYRINDLQGIVTALLNLGQTYIIMQDTFKAKQAWGFALEIDREGVMDDYTFDSYHDTIVHSSDELFFQIVNVKEEAVYYELPERFFYKGYIFFELGNYASAKDFFLNSVELSIYNKHEALLSRNYKFLALSFAKMNDFKRATLYWEKYDNINEQKKSQAFKDVMGLFMGKEIELKRIEKNASKTMVQPAISIWFYVALFFFISSSLLVFFLIRLKQNKRVD